MLLETSGGGVSTVVLPLNLNREENTGKSIVYT
jgi:hypothetical protein